MKSQRILFAAAGAALAFAAVYGIEITTPPPAYCAPTDQTKRVTRKTANRRRATRKTCCRYSSGAA